LIKKFIKLDQGLLDQGPLDSKDKKKEHPGPDHDRRRQFEAAFYYPERKKR